MPILSAWENPFNAAPPGQPPAILQPHRPDPVDIGFIRDQQKLLLPILEDFRGQAIGIIKKSSRLALGLSMEEVRIGVNFRCPDHPSIVQKFSLDIEDIAVAVPVRSPLVPPLEDLFRVQVRTATIPADNGQEVARSHMAVSSLIRSAGDDSQRQAIVYPDALKFVIHWITNLDGPPHDIAIRPFQLASAYTAATSFNLH